MLARQLQRSSRRAFAAPWSSRIGAARAASSADLQHCVDLLKKSDYDYYLMGLLLPDSARAGFVAVRAFNLETASIIDSVRGNVTPGRMRVQWWKDVVHDIYTTGNAPQGYPVAELLAQAVARHGLSRRWFDRCLEARMKDLEVPQPATMDDLEQYSSHTHGSLALLTLECLAPLPQQPSEEGGANSSGSSGFSLPECGYEGHAALDLAAEHFGRAVGCSTLLRGAAGHAERGRLYVPDDLLRAHNARANALLLGPDPVWLDGDEDSDRFELENKDDDDAEEPSQGVEQELEMRRRRRRQPPITATDRAAAANAVAALADRARAHLFAAGELSAGRWPVLLPPPPPSSSSNPSNRKPLGMTDLYDDDGEASYLQRCVESAGTVPLSSSVSRLAFLPGVRSAAYLAALERAGHDLHHPDLWPTYPSLDSSGSRSFLSADGALGYRLRLLGVSLGLPGASPFS